jgi:hypothetical protein
MPLSHTWILEAHGSHRPEQGVIKLSMKALKTNNHLLEELHGRPRRWENNTGIDFWEQSL